MPHLAKDLIEENIRTQHPILKLGNCGLDGTEEYLKLLKKCTHLRELNFANRWVEFDEQRKAWVTQRSSNGGKENILKQLPTSLPKSLIKLTACGQWNQHWEIVDLKPIQSLKNLQVVDFGYNQIQSLQTIKELIRLSHLFFKNNQIQNLQPIEGLQSLVYIDFENNQIQSLQPIEGLQNLIYIDFENNQINDLQPIKSLTGLTHINFANNQIDELHSIQRLDKLFNINFRLNKVHNLEAIQSLYKLKVIDFRSNQIKDITPIEGLNQLTSIDFRSNQIEDITAVRRLNKLTHLLVANNQIQDITPIKGLSKLTHLFCTNNHIKHFSLSLESLDKLKILYLWDNPIENIPLEIFNKKLENVTQTVYDYFQSIEKASRPLNEAKLIFVGAGEVGKTELVEAISNPQYKFTLHRETTKGIKIKKWSIDNLKTEKLTKDFMVNAWDFAGQEINYGTHQFFLTKNSVYIFVWDARKGEDQSMFRYWLEVISLLADQSPVIVVQNKIDIYDDDSINTQNWKNNFPNIKEFRKTSCKNKEGIEELRETIISSLIELPYTSTLWNQDRFRVRETLENHTADYISHREYLEICREHLLSANEAAFLGQQLHDIGVILHFDDDPYLKNTMVLKPEWVTEAAYCLLNNKQIPYGRFDLSILGKIWEKPSFAQQQGFLLRLMERFELVFKLHGNKEYIVPELLPVAPPSAVENIVSNTVQKLSFEYHYDFMPKGIMSHFICRIHAQIEQELFWRHGVVVKHENTFAKVIQNDTLVIKTISIEVWGKEAETLLLIIRNHFSQIHQELNNLPVKEYVPCICKDCIQSNTPYLHNYQTLKKCAEISREYYPCEKSLEDVSVNTLLRGIVQVAPQVVQDLLYLIDTAEIDKFFAQISKLGIKTGEIVRLQEHFIHDGGNFKFHQQLKVWVKKHFNL